MYFNRFDLGKVASEKQVESIFAALTRRYEPISRGVYTMCMTPHGFKTKTYRTVNHFKISDAIEYFSTHSEKPNINRSRKRNLEIILSCEKIMKKETKKQG
jgi:hypothetical protein